MPFEGKSPKEILRELVISSGAMTSLLITKEGHMIAEAGDVSYLNTTAMAALVAGMFSATREVARMVGEKHFSILLQQGEKRHIHISLVTDSTMMLIIFEDYARVGLVRHTARKTGKELIISLIETERIQKMPLENEDQNEPLVEMPTFKEYALNLIDRIFETDD